MGHAGAMEGGTWRLRSRVAGTYAPDRRPILLPLARQVRGHCRAVDDADISLAEIAERVAAVGIERVKRTAPTFAGGS